MLMGRARTASFRYRCAIAAFLLAALSAPPVRAQDKAPDDVTLAGQFVDANGSHAMLGVMRSTLAKAQPEKFASVGVKYENADENYHFNGTYTVLVASFMGAHEWRKFAAIWQTARAAHGEASAGNYFDGETELEVKREADGQISFSMAGNGDNGHGVPRDMEVFFLSPKDVDAFDRSVKQVSAYFAH
jgi:hypothetical protein